MGDKNVDGLSASTFTTRLESATKIFAILAGVFAVYQYLDTKKGERIKATLGYVDKFNSEDTAVNKAVTAISAALENNSANIARLNDAHLSKEQFADLHSRLAQEVLSQAADHKPIDPLLEIDSFFDTLHSCVDGNICDQRTAVRFFHSYASNIQNTFSPIIEKRSKSAPQFGQGIKWL